MLMTPDQPKREFTCKLRPEKCKETDMLNYLFDCYERVAYEERTAPKVGLFNVTGSIRSRRFCNIHVLCFLQL